MKHNKRKIDTIFNVKYYAKLRYGYKNAMNFMKIKKRLLFDVRIFVNSSFFVHDVFFFFYFFFSAFFLGVKT